MNPRLPLAYEQLEDGTEVGRFRGFVFVCRDGVPVSLPFTDIEPAAGGYVAHFGRDEYTLDKRGHVVSQPGYPNSFSDIARGTTDSLVESFLEIARQELCRKLEERDSQLVHYVSNARIRARYESGMG